MVVKLRNWRPGEDTLLQEISHRPNHQLHFRKECYSVQGPSFYVHLKRVQDQIVNPHMDLYILFWSPVPP